jgi:CheY-like chemotaxis protein
MSASVLIVDDNDLTRELLTDVLQTAGYRTAEAGDGQQALDYLHGRIDRPGVILLDLTMPVMDGWTFLRRRRREPGLAQVPVLVFTAADGFNADTMQALGATDMLRKPAQPKEVVAAVKRYC